MAKPWISQRADRLVPTLRATLAPWPCRAESLRDGHDQRQTQAAL